MMQQNKNIKNYSKKIVINLIILICLTISFQSLIFASEDVNLSIELISDKNIYNVGENVNLSLNINNQYNQIIDAKLQGEVLIGDTGYKIECYQLQLPKNQTSKVELSALPATLSNSNRKTLTTIYKCSGRNSQSTQTQVTNKQISQTGEENFLIGPFNLEYTINNTKKIVKSNIINITVKASQNNNQQSQNQNSNQNENEKNENQQQSQNSQSQNQNEQNNNQQNQKNQGLNQKQTQSLSQNQQNSASVNQLKQEIKQNQQELNNKNALNSNNLNNLNKTQIEKLKQKEKQKKYWIWFLIFLILIITIFGIYIKYFKKQNTQNSQEENEKPKETPEYLKLLNQIKNETNEKQKAKLLAQSIRTYIQNQNNINEKITNNQAIKITKNHIFIETLKKLEKIEFTNKNIKISYENLIKKVRKEYRIN